MIKLKQQRLRTAKVVCCTSGTPEGRLFESYIDGDADATGSATPVSTTSAGEVSIGVERFSFEQFLGFLRDEARASVSVE